MSSGHGSEDDPDRQTASNAQFHVVHRRAHEPADSESTGQVESRGADRGRPGRTGNAQEEADDENRPDPENLANMANVIGDREEAQDTDEYKERTDHFRPGQGSSHNALADNSRRLMAGERVRAERAAQCAARAAQAPWRFSPKYRTWP